MNKFLRKIVTLGVGWILAMLIIYALCSMVSGSTDLAKWTDGCRTTVMGVTPALIVVTVLLLFLDWD